MSTPSLPPIHECIDVNAILRKSLGASLKIANSIDFRIARDSPFTKSVLSGAHTGEKAEYTAWVSFREEREPCLRSLAFFCDALPPPVLNISKSNWVPTLEYTVHFWERPTYATSANNALKFQGKYWLRGRFRTDFVRNSFLSTDGELWDAEGTGLLASSRQFARVLLPRE
jgi:hypothetical protein